MLNVYKIIKRKKSKIFFCLLLFLISMNLIDHKREVSVIDFTPNNNTSTLVNITNVELNNDRNKSPIGVVTTATDHFERRMTIHPNNTTSTLVNLWSFKYVTNVELNNERKKSVIVLVTTAADHFEKRMTIRQTWANTERFPALDTVFFVGKSDNELTNAKIINESRIYGDMVQEDYMDTYLNLTTKTVFL